MPKKVAKKAVKSKAIKHKITDEDLQENPELAESGVVAGDVVEIDEEVAVEKPKRASKTGKYSIIDNNGDTFAEYIRTYDDETVAKEFASKKPTYKVVDEADITEVEVVFDEIIKGKLESKKEKLSLVEDGEFFKEEAIRRAKIMKGVVLVKI